MFQQPNYNHCSLHLSGVAEDLHACAAQTAAHVIQNWFTIVMPQYAVDSEVEQSRRVQSGASSGNRRSRISEVCHEDVFRRTRHLQGRSIIRLGNASVAIYFVIPEVVYIS